MGSRGVRAGVLAAAGVVAVLGLAGCEVRKEFAATCTFYGNLPDPPSPEGVVVVDVDVPLKVAPGATFTVRVDDIVGFADEHRDDFHDGVLSVTGAVTPSGTFHVGEGFLNGGTALPNTLTFTATGQDGDTIRVGAVEGGSMTGDFLHGRVATCSAGDALVATIAIRDP